MSLVTPNKRKHTSRFPLYTNKINEKINKQADKL